MRQPEKTRDMNKFIQSPNMTGKISRPQTDLTTLLIFLNLLNFHLFCIFSFFYHFSDNFINFCLNFLLFLSVFFLNFRIQILIDNMKNSLKILSASLRGAGI